MHCFSQGSPIVNSRTEHAVDDLETELWQSGFKYLQKSLSNDRLHAEGHYQQLRQHTELKLDATAQKVGDHVGIFE
jgi:hypothetical protein